MQFTVDQDVMAESIRVITRLAPPINGNVTIQSDGAKLWMHSGSEVSKCSINLPATVTGKANVFAIGLGTLKDATKGRQKLNFEYSKTMCLISSGTYKCELATVDAIELDSDDDIKEKPIKISVEQASWLKSAVATVALKPTTLLSTFMPVAIRLTARGAFIACYDVNHMAFLNSKEITGDMDLKLPLDVLSGVLDAFAKAPFKLELSKSNLFVTNNLVKVALALPQEEENELKIEEVIEAAQGSRTSKGLDITIDKHEILAFLDNARALATKERSEIKIQTEAGKMKLEILTANGSMKTVIKAACLKQAKAMIDFEFLDEAVRKSNEVSMKLVNDEFIAFKLKEGTVVVSLNQGA